MFKLITIGLTKNLKLGFSNFYCKGKKKIIYNIFFLGPGQGVLGLVLEPPLPQKLFQKELFPNTSSI